MVQAVEGVEQSGGGGGAALAGGTSGDRSRGPSSDFSSDPSSDPSRDPARGDGGADGALRVELRYFAGAAAAAGLDEEVVLLDEGATLGALLAHLRDVHPRLAAVLEVASTLVDEVAVTDPGAVLRHGVRVDVLPPFAGG